MLIVLGIATSVYYIQYRSNYHHRMTAIQNDFAERVLILENMIKAAVDHVQSTQIIAQHFLKAHPVPPSSTLFQQLRMDSQEDYFALDTITPPFQTDHVGNLTGLGTLDKRTPDFYRDVEMALALNASLYAALQNLPNVVWAYYTSKHQFINLQPWVSSQEFRFSAAVYNEPYSVALPENNPKRQWAWTKAYIDEGGKGLMVTCSAPVYDKDKFFGAISLDFTLDHLNEFIRGFDPAQGTLFLRSAKNELLAHPSLVNTQDNAVKTAEQALPISLAFETLLQGSPMQWQQQDETLMLYSTLRYAPWQLVLVTNTAEIQTHTLLHSSRSFIVFLTGLVLLWLLSHYLIHREFVQPSKHLIEHIELENQGKHRAIPTSIPPAWKPWFINISDIFKERREKAALLKAISEAQTEFIADMDVHQLFSVLLEKLLTLTNSEYGLIGEILLDEQQQPYLKIYATTDISWDAETRAIYESVASTGMDFRNLNNLLGEVMRSGQAVLSNAPSQDSRRGGLPKGHPPLNAYLGIPFHHQNRLVGMVGLANRPGGFQDELLEFLKPLLATCASIIDAYNNELLRRNTEQAALRFVPLQFLRLLNRTALVDVHLGDQVEKNMTILFSDIRDFTTLSETMTPQENFNFINTYLGYMEPVITEWHGFIDKYIGDAIMGLFPTTADDAVQGALAIFRALRAFNQALAKDNKPPIRIGVGLNTGALMLGTVGGKNRMDGTVISDAVNLASRIESLNKVYGSHLLITETTYNQLADPTQYCIRLMDRVKVKGKSEETTIYEVLDGETCQQVALKKATRVEFEKGVRAYMQQDLLGAKQAFQTVSEINHQDKAVQVYLQRCR